MPDFILALGLVICLFTDLKERKIYNIVLIPLLIFGLTYNLITGAGPGLMQSILGTLTGLGILIIPFAFGGIGAGDVKLLAVIGAIKGPLFVFYTAVGMGIAGGMIALLVLTFQGSIINTLKSFFRGIWLMLTTRFKVIKFDFDNEKTMLPYGLAIVSGVVGAYLWMG